MTFKTVYHLARRARYKFIEPDYCHFVFQGFRIEALQEKDNYIVCVCKGGAAKKTNDNHNFNDMIVCIKDKKDSFVYNDKLYKRLDDELRKYMKTHEKWFNSTK